MMKSKFIMNLSWIFVGNIIHAVLQFLINVLVARYLSEAIFGEMNYALSIITIFTSICSLGFNGVIVKKFAEKEDVSGTYLFSATVFRIVVSLFCSVGLIIFVFITKPEDQQFHKIFICMLLQLIFSSGDLFLYWFRYKYQAKIVALVRLFSFLLCSLFRIIALVFYNNVALYVFFTSIEIGMMVLILVYIYLKMKGPKLNFSISKVNDLLKISYPFIFSAVLIAIYGQTDKIMLNSMVSEEAVAYYSISLTLAGAISIIPSALIEGFRPSIMQFKQTNEKLYKNRFKQLYFTVFWICVFYGIIITLLAKPLILFLYGSKYLPSVSSLSLVVWYTSFSYFGSINNIYMIAENKTKWVQYITFIGAITNVVLNLVLIPIMNIEGAALASLLTQFLANFVLLFFIKPLRGCFCLMIKGIFYLNLKNSL